MMKAKNLMLGDLVSLWAPANDDYGYYIVSCLESEMLGEEVKTINVRCYGTDKSAVLSPGQLVSAFRVDEHLQEEAVRLREENEGLRKAMRETNDLLRKADRLVKQSVSCAKDASTAAKMAQDELRSIVDAQLKGKV